MTTHSRDPWWDRMYRGALALYPKSVRERFGHDMVECFRDLRTQANTHAERG